MLKVTLHVEGMMCPKCEAHMNEAIRKSLGVKDVSSSRTEKQTSFVCETVPDEETLRKIVEDAGYRLLGFESETIIKKRFGIF